MKNIEVKLNFFKSTESLPRAAQDGKKFLLCWSWGGHYSLASWNVGRQSFYNDDGSYLLGSNPFVYAELPANLES